MTPTPMSPKLIVGAAGMATVVVLLLTAKAPGRRRTRRTARRAVHKAPYLAEHARGSATDSSTAARRKTSLRHPRPAHPFELGPRAASRGARILEQPAHLADLALQILQVGTELLLVVAATTLCPIGRRVVGMVAVDRPLVPTPRSVCVTAAHQLSEQRFTIHLYPASEIAGSADRPLSRASTGRSGWRCRQHRRTSGGNATTASFVCVPMSSISRPGLEHQGVGFGSRW
jgi:hypothetical protein